jgi:hypothetical protein
MVNYEVTTLKKDFDDLFEGTERKHFRKRLDLSLESRHPFSFRFDFSFGGSRITLGFDSLGSCQPLSS